MKGHNRSTKNVTWNDQEITAKMHQENMKWIKSIHNRHDTLFCDPFLLLIAEVFKVDIDHHYLRDKVIYKHPEAVGKLFLDLVEVILVMLNE